MGSRNDDFQYLKWAAEIKKRDEYTCQICGRRGLYIESHHKNCWADYPDERYDLENGVALCAGFNGGCHNRYHEIYGKGGNTYGQYEEFEDICNKIDCIVSRHLKCMMVVSDLRIRTFLEERYSKDGYSGVQVSNQ